MTIPLQGDTHPQQGDTLSSPPLHFKGDPIHPLAGCHGSDSLGGDPQPSAHSSISSTQSHPDYLGPMQSVHFSPKFITPGQGDIIGTPQYSCSNELHLGSQLLLREANYPTEPTGSEVTPLLGGGDTFLHIHTEHLGDGLVAPAPTFSTRRTQTEPTQISSQGSPIPLSSTKWIQIDPTWGPPVPWGEDSRPFTQQASTGFQFLLPLHYIPGNTRWA